ncbi:MAG: rod shape-determining protein MreD [Nocardioidaceae bacterium]|nr:rod shape-determining protein MreD [Nocardioidaceae bacterium]MCL2612878.1 rod shape-determining protein MreD [Nocardioidaceae bacterium]
MRSPRVVTAAVLVVVGLLLQTTVLPALGWPDAGAGAVPSVVLLVVVGTALVTDTRFATLTGFFAGLLLDLAPPADHLAGRWALALMTVGYVVGRLSHDNQPDIGAVRRSGPLLIVASSLGGSFVGNSVYALTGLVLRDLDLSTSQVLRVIGIGLGWDLLGAALVVPAVMWIHRRVDRLGSAEPARVSLR